MITSTQDSQFAFEADLSLQRLMPRLEAYWRESGISDVDARDFQDRLQAYWLELFTLLFELYGQRYDFFFHLEQILLTAAEAWAQRPEALRETDRQRINDSSWYLSERMVGGALYVDLFSENLGRLRESIGYFQRLGLTYLHLMPLFAVRPGENDGGYAISNYRSVDPRLGTIDDLRLLADELRAAGITLVLDFVFNHTADDHEWAQQAQSGNREYQQFYYIFENREIPDQYEATLREIFPAVRRGNFTWHDGMERWVWTTFNSYQWDLNYSNPATFRAMLGEMYAIAQTGVDVLRLDAIAFIWKEMGTSCENLPKAHKLVQAYNRLCRIATPGLLFKSEAIVHPDEVVKYVGEDKCQISYNPTLMALLWESLATRRTDLLMQSLSHRHKLPDRTAWVNYLRCHDDIGWTFDDADAAQIGINAYDHRNFLNRFYTGQFEGSFARGIPFQENLETGDVRIAGTMASLAGLELAVENNDAEQMELAFRRIILLQSITISIGGIPLLYLGEEWGMLNDYDFIKDPAKASDARWVHRPKMKWEFVEQLDRKLEGHDGTIRTRIFTALQNVIEARKNHPALAGQDMKLVRTENPHLLMFVRSFEGHRLLIIGNFSEHPQPLSPAIVRNTGLGRFFHDVVSQDRVGTMDTIRLEPYQVMWLERE